MLKIRFLRVGRKHDPTFRLVVTDSRKAPRSAAYLENLGFYDPLKGSSNVKPERVKHWISKGAKLSDTAHNFLIKSKVMEGKKINVTKKAKNLKKTEQKDTS